MVCVLGLVSVSAWWFCHHIPFMLSNPVGGMLFSGLPVDPRQGLTSTPRTSVESASQQRSSRSLHAIRPFFDISERAYGGVSENSRMIS